MSIHATLYSKLLACLCIVSSPYMLRAWQNITEVGSKTVKSISAWAVTSGAALANGLVDKASDKKNADTKQQLIDYKHGKKLGSSIRPYDEWKPNEKILLQQELFDVDRKYTSDKPLVLFFGNTGSGKSTIIKYLLGVDLTYQDGSIHDLNEDKGVIEQPGGVGSPRIGYTEESETMGVHFYDQHRLGLALTDTEGFSLGRCARGRHTTLVKAIVADYTPYFTLLTNSLQGSVPKNTWKHSVAFYNMLYHPTMVKGIL